MAVFDREWRDGDRLVLRLPMEVTTSRWYENSVAVERGPLVYALAMRETWEKNRSATARQPSSATNITR